MDVPYSRLLNSTKHAGKVRVLAHSMGNIVVGEGLRILAESDNSTFLHTYVTTQAAVSAHAYDNKLPDDASFVGGLAGPVTPEVMAHYYSGNSFRDKTAYFEKNVKVIKEGRMFRYFNEVDYALSRWWPRNNYLKPDIAQGYHYTGDTVDYLAYPNNSRFYYDSLFELNDERELRFDSNRIIDRYEIFAFCAESRSNTLGSVKKIKLFDDESEQSGKDFNLREGDLQYNDKHYSHSRQFRSNIIMEWPYWAKLTNDCGLEN